jgi:hypothetical protein
LRSAFSVWFSARSYVVVPFFSTPLMLKYVAAMCMWMWRHAEDSFFLRMAAVSVASPPVKAAEFQS